MSLKDIIFRFITKAGHTTKGTELTHEELDENFENIIDHLNKTNQAAAGSIEPYDNGATYDPAIPNYVSYSGNIYFLIAGSPTTGIVPDSDPLTWEIVSEGALAHVKNTDAYLARGTADQVSAAEIRAHLDAVVGTPLQYIELIWSEFLALAASGDVIPRTFYRITDKGFGMQGAMVYAVDAVGTFTPLGDMAFGTNHHGVTHEIATTSDTIDLMTAPEAFALVSCTMFEIDHTGAGSPLIALNSGGGTGNKFAIRPKGGTTMQITIADSGTYTGLVEGEFTASPSVAAGTYTLDGSKHEYIVFIGLGTAYGGALWACRAIEISQEVI